ncbi:MAG: precorrin-3B C(17)-methyltransferase [Bacillota bacterium]
MQTLFVAGFGPGDPSHMTAACRDALEAADVIVGYSMYVDLLRPLYPNKRTYATPMMREEERCRAALKMAAGGETVAVVCSGDAGVYGMAGLILELAAEYPSVEVVVVPGVTAALAGAAVLGAPLSHDFAVVSLSDLLTPWEQIQRRLDCAAAGDFCIALYNPSSKKRSDYLARACDILLRHKSKDTLCGLVQNIGRDGESKAILPLGELRNAQVDMFTTVFVGNAQTKEILGRMVTPRGYRLG